MCFNSIHVMMDFIRTYTRCRVLIEYYIETDFNRSSFFQKSRKVPEVTDLSIVCGWGGFVCRVSSLSS